MPPPRKRQSEVNMDTSVKPNKKPKKSGDDPDAGDPDAGDPGAGDPGAGDPDAGDPDAGDPGAGDPGAGDPGAGDPAWEDCLKDITASIKCIVGMMSKHDNNIITIQEKYKNNGEVSHDLTPLTTDFKSSQDEYLKLQVKLNNFQRLVKNVSNSELQLVVEKLKAENVELKERLEKAELKIEKLQKRNQGRKNRITDLEKKSKKLEKEVNQLKRIIKVKTPDDEQEAALNVGQLCTEIQCVIYGIVFEMPVNFKYPHMYKLSKLKCGIETDKKAKKRWVGLRHTLNWGVRLEDAIKSLSSRRNIIAHCVKPKVLSKHVDILERRNYFKGTFSIKEVKKLIKIWKNFKNQGRLKVN